MEYAAQRRAVSGPALDRPLLLHRRRRQPHSPREWRPPLRSAFDRPLDGRALADLLSKPRPGPRKAAHSGGGRLQSGGTLARRDPACDGVLTRQAEGCAGDRTIPRPPPRPGTRLARRRALCVTRLVARRQGAGLLRAAGPYGPFPAVVPGAPGGSDAIAKHLRLTVRVGVGQSIPDRGPYTDAGPYPGAGDRGCRPIRDVARCLVLSRLGRSAQQTAHLALIHGAGCRRLPGAARPAGAARDLRRRIGGAAGPGA